MPAYITLANFTDQGARNIKDSPARFDAFVSMAKAAGVTIKSAHYTTGAFDMVVVSEGSEEAMMGITMKMATLGNVRTQTMRGCSVEEMKKMAGSLG